MRILITGGGGQLGQALTERLHAEHRVLPVPHAALDVTDYAACRQVIGNFVPDLVIHAAAWTDVDGCEQEPGRCHRVNAGGAWNVAAASAEGNAAVMLISTDFVFDGQMTLPYPEHHPTNPLSQYGLAKEWAEYYVADANPKSYVVRTQWLYGPGQKNFATAILGAASRAGPLKVVTDQIGVPTSCAEAARQIGRILLTPRYGLYHVNNAGEANWFAFAVELFHAAGLDASRIQPISAAEWPSPVTRPFYSVLRRGSQELLGLDDAREWQADAQAFARRWKEAQGGG